MENGELKMDNIASNGMKFRYRTDEEMKESGVEWIPKIPVSWLKNKLKRELKFSVGATPSTSNKNYFEGDNIWICISDLDGKYCYNSKTKLSDSAIISTNMKKVPSGSLLYSFKLSVGHVAFAEKELYTNEAIAAFYPNNKYNLNFWYYALGCYLIKNANENIYGAKLLNQDLINNSNIFIPSKVEQEKIAKFLDVKTAEFDSIISKKEALIEKLEEAKKSLISEVITGKVKVIKTEEGYQLIKRKREEMKDSGVEWIRYIPNTWKVKKIKYNTYVKGRIGWQGLKSDEFIDYGPYLVTGTDLKNGIIDWNTCYHISEERYCEAPEIQLRNGDLLITKDGTIGKLAIVKECPEKAILNSGIFVTRCTNYDYLTEFMYYVLLSDIFKKYVDLTSVGSTIQHLYQYTFVNFSYPLPNLNEQKNIIDYLSQKTNSIDNIIETIRKQIDKLKEAKQSLISEAVTGKIEILD